MTSIKPVEAECETNSEDVTLLLSAAKLAQALDISIRTLWRLRAAGKLPAPIRLNGSVRWRRSEIESWIAAGCAAKVPGDRQHKHRKPRPR